MRAAIALVLGLLIGSQFPANVELDMVEVEAWEYSAYLRGVMDGAFQASLKRADWRNCFAVK